MMHRLTARREDHAQARRTIGREHHQADASPTEKSFCFFFQKEWLFPVVLF